VKLQATQLRLAAESRTEDTPMVGRPRGQCQLRLNAYVFASSPTVLKICSAQYQHSSQALSTATEHESASQLTHQNTASETAAAVMLPVSL